MAEPRLQSRSAWLQSPGRLRSLSSTLRQRAVICFRKLRNMKLVQVTFQPNEPVCAFDNRLLSMTQSSSSHAVEHWHFRCPQRARGRSEHFLASISSAATHFQHLKRIHLCVANVRMRVSMTMLAARTPEAEAASGPPPTATPR